MISGRALTADLNCHDPEVAFERLDNLSPQVSRSSETEALLKERLF
ncbi:MAG: hypothetical protein WCJ71_05360 [Candidatus Omnitrophota bacterium]